MKTFYTISFLLIVVIAQAQQSNDFDNKNGALAIGTGLSLYSIRDQNISNEKYSGILIPVNLTWSSLINDQQTRDFYFNINTGSINNYSVKAHVNELSFGWNYRFNLTPQKRRTIFWGPAPYIYLHNRTQTTISLHQYSSGLALVSLAGIFGIESNNLDTFNYKMVGRLGLLSAAVNTKEDQLTKVLTPLNGLQFYFSAQTSYKLNNWAGIYLKYSFQTYHITAWNKFYSISDQLSLNFLFSF